MIIFSKKINRIILWCGKTSWRESYIQNMPIAAIPMHSGTVWTLRFFLSRIATHQSPKHFSERFRKRKTSIGISFAAHELFLKEWFRNSRHRGRTMYTVSKLLTTIQPRAMTDELIKGFLPDAEWKFFIHLMHPFLISATTTHAEGAGIRQLTSNCTFYWG
jgi:hypothetical protein